MSATSTKVRVGVTSARELEFEVEDVDAMVAAVEGAMGAGDPMVWITDVKGHRHGIALDKLAFLEIEGEVARTGVGFGLVSDVTGG